jgi:hypothetical protein
MITVIATGFDGGRKRQSTRHEAAAGQPTETSLRAPRERDFLEELERQRSQSADGGFEIPPADERGAAAAHAAPTTPRVERTVGEPVPVKRAAAYDADDLEIPSFLRRK